MSKSKKELQGHFLEVLELCQGNVCVCCKQTNISRSLYYKWKQNKKFSNKVDEIQKGLIDFTESQLHKLIFDLHFGAIKCYLEAKGKDRGYVKKVESDIKVTNTPKAIDLTSLTDEELEFYQKLQEKIESDIKEDEQ